jgi:hypothetical protein
VFQVIGFFEHIVDSKIAEKPTPDFPVFKIVGILDRICIVAFVAYDVEIKNHFDFLAVVVESFSWNILAVVEITLRPLLVEMA